MSLHIEVGSSMKVEWTRGRIEIQQAVRPRGIKQGYSTSGSANFVSRNFFFAKLLSESILLTHKWFSEIYSSDFFFR